jgi:hypothetical protein
MGGDGTEEADRLESLTKSSSGAGSSSQLVQKSQVAAPTLRARGGTAHSAAAAVAAEDPGDGGGGSDGFSSFTGEFRRLFTLPIARRRLFTDAVLSIEVQFGAEHGLVKVFFPRPAVCGFLTEQQQQTAHERLDYTLDDAQVLRDFFRLTEGITDEIQHRRRLAGSGEAFFVGTFLKVTTNESFEVVPWVLAMCLNFMLIISVRRPPDQFRSQGDSSFYFEPASFQAGVHGLGRALLIANLAMVLSTVALQAPLLWVSLERRAVDAASREVRLGPVRRRQLLRSCAVAFAPPLAWVVGLLIARTLIHLTGVDGQSPELRAIMQFIALIVTVPFLRALRTVLELRPFFLNSAARAFVFVYDTCTFEGLTWKLIFTIINVSKSSTFV